jgi:hypothetical protein
MNSTAIGIVHPAGRLVGSRSATYLCGRFYGYSLLHPLDHRLKPVDNLQQVSLNMYSRRPSLTSSWYKVIKMTRTANITRATYQSTSPMSAFSTP